MNADDIRTLFAYDRWANERVFESVAHLPTAEFIRDLGTSHGSLRGTLVHVLWADWIWLQRWPGESIVDENLRGPWSPAACEQRA